MVCTSRDNMSTIAVIYEFCVSDDVAQLNEEISTCWIRAVSARVERVDRTRATPFTCIRIQRIERNARTPFSMFSSLSNTRRWRRGGAALVVGRRTPLAVRDNSSAVSSTTSTRNRLRRARMLCCDRTWSPNRHTTQTRHLDPGHHLSAKAIQIFIFGHLTQWI